MEQWSSVAGGQLVVVGCGVGFGVEGQEGSQALALATVAFY